jgi:hypothetical protein
MQLAEFFDVRRHRESCMSGHQFDRKSGRIGHIDGDLNVIAQAMQFDFVKRFLVRQIPDEQRFQIIKTKDRMDTAMSTSKGSKVPWQSGMMQGM